MRLCGDMRKHAGKCRPRSCPPPPWPGSTRIRPARGGARASPGPRLCLAPPSIGGGRGQYKNTQKGGQGVASFLMHLLPLCENPISFNHLRFILQSHWHRSSSMGLKPTTFPLMNGGVIPYTRRRMVMAKILAIQKKNPPGSTQPNQGPHHPPPRSEKNLRPAPRNVGACSYSLGARPDGCGTTLTHGVRRAMRCG